MASAVPLPTRISAQFHLQAWVDPVGALNIRLTDGLRGWEARLDTNQLRRLADDNHFRDDRDGLEQYRALTLCSLTSCAADCTFSADIAAAEVTMRWTRACVIEGVLPEAVSGVARGAESPTAFRALREQLAARLDESASTVVAVEDMIASINTRLEQAQNLTRGMRSKLDTLREDRAVRFFRELNTKKRALEDAVKAGSDSGSDSEDAQVEDSQADAGAAGTDAPAACPPGSSSRGNPPDDHAASSTLAQAESGLMSLLHF